jgi:hypothetical protein
MALRTKHLLIVVLVFVAEILVATRLAHIGFIRSYFGDFLVVILLYHLVKVFREMAPLPLAIGVFFFSCIIETLQYFHLADVLGLPHGSLLRIIIGTHFSWADILMYLLGCVTSYGFDSFVLTRASRD